MQPNALQSKSIQAVHRQAKQYALAPWPILIQGETGVGKEVWARYLHEISDRACRPFVTINCAALPSGLIESELFGFERGAFSGAGQRFGGVVRQAQRGTLFLDEIAELELALQAKLLRFLDSGEVRSLGSTQIENIDVRFIAATNVPLERVIASNRFRLDLFERLSVLTLNLPPLRERRADIWQLAQEIADSWGMSLDQSVERFLIDFEWPGNIRQLRNVLARASALGEGEISSEIVEEILSSERESATYRLLAFESAPLEDIERSVILNRLLQNGGNRKRTAEALGIAKSTLHEKLRRWRAELPYTRPLSLQCGPGSGS